MAGYIGSTPVPQGIQEQQSFTATAGQTTFNTLGYTDGNTIRVTLNGVLLEGGGVDYTATNGSDIVLTAAASVDDILTFETFNEFQLVSQTMTTPTISGGTLKSNVTLKNDTEQDTDGGRASKIIYQGEQSGGEISTLAEIQASHDGTADDEKADLIFRTNDGSDGTSPTERMRIDSDGNIGVGINSPSSMLHLFDGGTDTGITLQSKVQANATSSIAFMSRDSSNVNQTATIKNNAGTLELDSQLDVSYAGGGDFIAKFQNTTDATPYGIHVKDAASGANGYPLFQVTNGAGNSTYFRADSGTGYVVMPKIPAFNTAGYKDHTVSGTGAVVMSSSNVWSQYVSHGYASTNSGWDVGTGTFTAPVAGRYCFTLAYQLSSHNSGYFYTYIQHNGVTKTYQYSPQTTNQIPIAQNAILNMAANDTARVVYLTNYVSGIISLVSFSGHLIG